MTLPNGLEPIPPPAPVGAVRAIGESTMFYCQKCALENGWPYFYGLPESRGACEVCKKFAVCVDVPSHALPRKETPADKS